METADIQHFERLKEKVVRKMQQLHPEIPSRLSDWKGQDILTFQVELREREKGHVSEKWFYTHMKSGSEKLPRIDTLNLLSRFAGYKNWDDFTYHQRGGTNSQKQNRDRSNSVFIVVPLLVLTMTLLFYLAVSTVYNQEYSFCFIDKDSGEAVDHQTISVSVLYEGESPVYYRCNESGCFSLRHDHRTLSFVVEAPGYQTDTIVRRLNMFNREEMISLRPHADPEP